MSYLRSRPSSSTSRNPAVVINPVFAPLRSMSALLNSVVAWITRVDDLASANAVQQVPKRPCDAELRPRGDGRGLGNQVVAPNRVKRDQVGKGSANVDAENPGRRGLFMGDAPSLKTGTGLITVRMTGTGQALRGGRA